MRLERDLRYVWPTRVCQTDWRVGTRGVSRWLWPRVGVSVSDKDCVSQAPGCRYLTGSHFPSGAQHPGSSLRRDGPLSIPSYQGALNRTSTWRKQPSVHAGHVQLFVCSFLVGRRFQMAVALTIALCAVVTIHKARLLFDFLSNLIVQFTFILTGDATARHDFVNV